MDESRGKSSVLGMSCGEGWDVWRIYCFFLNDVLRFLIIRIGVSLAV